MAVGQSGEGGGGSGSGRRRVNGEVDPGKARTRRSATRKGEERRAAAPRVVAPKRRPSTDHDPRQGQMGGVWVVGGVGGEGRRPPTDGAGSGCSHGAARRGWPAPEHRHRGG